MRNIKLIIEYDGTNYAGWQIQNSPQSAPIRQAGAVHRPQTKTIQETIEKVLEKILQEKVKVIGSGRTDSGVHALAQTANFRTHSLLAVSKIQKALNSLLPKDISLKEIGEADKDFHSRYSAKSKTYRYFILNSETRSAFLNKYVWHIPYRLNVSLMRKEADALLGRHDFKSFCASGSSAKTTIRTIKKLSIETRNHKPSTIGYKLIIIDIESDGFLYNMVRNIVGTLFEIGRGKFPEGNLKKILLAQNRKQAGPTAPAQGLFLVEVKY
ncbi:MAG: tRNA pseudouridine(38-40) synthase TruA [Candidatus Omnitrophota bacterium]|nr:tRNA pseudouridine(38-40) synthase TruA [Candidatus Omnitrophota bacterium]